jgi:hypothetical protein
MRCSLLLDALILNVNTVGSKISPLNPSGHVFHDPSFTMPPRATGEEPTLLPTGAAANMSSNASLNDAEVTAAANQMVSLDLSEGQADAKRSDTSSDGDGASPPSGGGGRILDPELWKAHPPTEDCPVCFVPLSVDESESSTYWVCCGKIICTACTFETLRATKIISAKRAKKKLPPLSHACSFCRTIPNVSQSEYEERIRKGDGKAAYNLAFYYRDGDTEKRIPQDEAKSVELLHRAADDLRSSAAMATLGSMYLDGQNGAAIDATKGRKYLEDAIKMGNVGARFVLGWAEGEEKNMDLAIRHWKLAAAAGEEHSVKMLWKCFFKGMLEKNELEEALRAHKEACDSMNSEERGRCALLHKAIADNDVFLTNILRSYYNGEIKVKELNKALKAHQG